MPFSDDPIMMGIPFLRGLGRRAHTINWLRTKSNQGNHSCLRHQRSTVQSFSTLHWNPPDGMIMAPRLLTSSVLWNCQTERLLLPLTMLACCIF